MNPQNHHILPEGWEIKRLGEIAINGTQNGLYKGPKFYGSGLEMVHMTDIFRSEEIVNNQMARVSLGAKEIEKFKLKTGDLLFARRSLALDGVAKCAIVGKLSENITFESSIIRVALNEEKVSPKYVFYFIQSRKGMMEKMKLARQVAVSGITGEDLKLLPIPLPPLAEQRQIAAVLGTWDQAIKQTTELLKVLRIRHRGLMQQLLTGKKRLPGFEGGFKYLEIGEVAQEISVRNRHDKALTVLSCTKYDGLVDSLSYFGRKIYSDDLTTYKIVSHGEFAYATNHIEEGSIGYQSAYDSALISPMYTVFKTDSTVYDPFLYFILKTERYIQEYKKNMVGSIDRRGGLRWNDFSKIVIPLPHIEEQRAIACVLDASLKEIRQNEDKREALRKQKRGLMQCLLTGHIRVPLPAEVV